MTIRRKRPETRRPESVEDIETAHPVVVEGFGAGMSAEPLPVRLSDVWSDFLRLAGEPDAAMPSGKPSAVPILDDMKGILQWD